MRESLLAAVAPAGLGRCLGNRLPATSAHDLRPGMAAFTGPEPAEGLRCGVLLAGFWRGTGWVCPSRFVHDAQGILREVQSAIWAGDRFLLHARIIRPL